MELEAQINSFGSWYIRHNDEEWEQLSTREVCIVNPNDMVRLPDRVVRNGPALICFWRDWARNEITKVVVKCHDEEFDYEKGIAMAILRRHGIKRNRMRRCIQSVEVQEEDDGGR